MNSKFLQFSFFAWAFLSANLAAEKPNVVLIMCDDMGFSDIGCYGGEVLTPNIDRMAKEDMRFTQFYNNAKCTTTRASIVTGLFPRKPLLNKEMLTIGEAMKRAGYRTSLSGKWHLGSGDDTHPYKRGFDEYYGLLDGCCNFFNPSQPDPSYKGGRIRKFGQNDERITKFPKNFYTTDAFTDHAISCIEKFSKEKKPFFAHLCYTAPHYPLHAKPRDIAKYVGKFKMGWEQMRKDRWDRLQKNGLAAPNWKLTSTDSKSYSWKGANQDFEDLRMAVYAAMIDCMDQNIGRILKALDETGAARNTLVLFLSDNGGCSEEPGGRDPAKRRPGPGDDYVCVGPAWGWAQNSPFKRYKSWVHEGGITTPLVAWWPGKVPAGSVNREPAHIIDFLPTCLDLADSAFPEKHEGRELIPLDGSSMLPLLLGEKRERAPFYAWFWSGNRAYRKGDRKLVWDSRIKKWELYDLAQDRCETTDLAKKHPEEVKALS
ncbi:MAG: arylsulfatase, partial [Opitutales bacterium]